MSVEEQPFRREYTAQRLLKIVGQNNPRAEFEKVTLALKLVQDVHQELVDNQLGPHFQTSALEQALAIATILAQARVDATGVSAGLVFEAVDTGLLTLERVRSTLEDRIASIIEKGTSLLAIENKRRSIILEQSPTEIDIKKSSKEKRTFRTFGRRQSELTQKMYSSVADDPRTMMLRLAYQLHWMRLIASGTHSLNNREMQILVHETREIYAPLARYLEMVGLADEMEDLAFKILDPGKYRWVRTQIDGENKRWQVYIEDVQATLREFFEELGLKAEVFGRAEHMYGLYKKICQAINASDDEPLARLQSAGIDFNQMEVLLTFSILVETLDDCYQALEVVHALWKPKTEAIEDFIANPKPNGYKALHTTVYYLANVAVEMRICSYEMQHITKPDSRAEYWRDMKIFLLTPKGHVIDLPVGATPLDFAYRIHTELGHSYVGARVDGHPVRIDHELKNGDLVELVTSQTRKGPNPEWLSTSRSKGLRVYTFARARHTRQKIRQYLRDKDEK